MKKIDSTLVESMVSLANQNSYSEIAKILNLSVSSVHRYLSRIGVASAVRGDIRLCRVCKESRTKRADGTYSWCIPCKQKSFKTYVESHREEKASYNKKYALANKTACKIRRQAWVERNRGIVNGYTAKRKSFKIKATPVWADDSKIREFYVSSHALSMLIGEYYHVDHIVPLLSESVCGLHCESNLEILPASVNISKGNRSWPDMW